jgi:hypothetical protein
VTPESAKVGTRVRVLVEVNGLRPDPVPSGAAGRIVGFYLDDDNEYHVTLDEYPGSCVPFTEHELEQLELVRG